MSPNGASLLYCPKARNGQVWVSTQMRTQDIAPSRCGTLLPPQGEASERDAHKGGIRFADTVLFRGVGRRSLARSHGSAMAQRERSGDNRRIPGVAGS